MPSTLRGSDNFDTAGGNAVKAWVNFNGTGTVAIRASFNVSSITDNGTGLWTVNFTTALADANYVCTAGSSGFESAGASVNVGARVGRTAASCPVYARQSGGTNIDPAELDFLFAR